MANSNKLQQSKANDRVPGLKGSSGSERRFQRYCARTSFFPPPPPVPTLTAAQRLKRFKAICKKQQLAAANGRKSTKRNLAITLIVRKKGIRKSSTPGKSPFVKSARKSISRKELLRSAQVHNMKVLTAGMDNGVSNPYNNLDNSEQYDQPTFSAENIQDRKKELLKKLFAGEKVEQKSCATKSSMKAFVEYPEDSGSNDSEEIDVVTNRHEVNRSDEIFTNGSGNRENGSFEISHGNSSISNGDICQNGDTVKDVEVDANSENVEIKISSLETNGNETIGVASEIVKSHSEEVNGEVSEEISPDKRINGRNQGEPEEESFFDAVLQAPVEKNVSSQSDAGTDEETPVLGSTIEAAESVVDASQAASDSRAVFVTAEVHAETDELVPETNSINKFDVVESNAESNSRTEESLVESNRHGETGFEENEVPSFTSDKQTGKKKTKSLKSSTPVKQKIPKTQASSRKKPQKRKSLTPIIVRKPKSKQGSSLELVVEKPEDTVIVKRSKKRRVTPIFKVAPAHIESHAYFSSGSSVLGSPTSDAPPVPEFHTDQPEDVSTVSKQRNKKRNVNYEVSEEDLDSSEYVPGKIEVSTSRRLKTAHVTEIIPEKAKDVLNKSKSKKGSRKSKKSAEDFDSCALSPSETQVSVSPVSDASLTAETVVEKAEGAARKPKIKQGSQKSESSDVEKPVDSYGRTSFSAFAKPRTSPFLEVVIEEAEKSFISSDSENDVESLKPSPMVRRSQFKCTEPVASCSKDKPEKTSVITPAQQDIRESSTSKSAGPRRSQRSFSPSRRAPLRSNLRSGTSIFESTPFDSTPLLKRKADADIEGESAKRTKEETHATPRWNILSSPLKSYWSPQLTNKVTYTQPESSLTPDQFSSISEPETPASSDNANESDSNDKTWCTIS